MLTIYFSICYTCLSPKLTGVHVLVTKFTGICHQTSPGPMKMQFVVSVNSFTFHRAGLYSVYFEHFPPELHITGRCCHHHQFLSPCIQSSDFCELFYITRDGALIRALIFVNSFTLRQVRLYSGLFGLVRTFSTRASTCIDDALTLRLEPITAQLS